MFLSSFIPRSIIERKWQNDDLPQGDYLGEVQMDVMELGNKDGCHHLIKDRSVQVDVGCEGQHEANDPVADADSLLTALDSAGHSGSAWGHIGAFPSELIITLKRTKV